MKKKYVSRREFLRVSAVTAAGLLAASCAGQPIAPAAQQEEAAAPAAQEEAPAAAAPAGEEVTLECGVDTYTEQGATASDLCEGDLTASIVIDASSV